MTKEQIINEMQTIIDSAKKEERALNETEEKRMKELEGMIDVLKKESRAREMQEELRAQMKPADSKKEDAKEVRSELARAIMEKRAITVNGAGATAYIRDIVMQKIEKAPWLSQLDYIVAANANTIIPVLAPIPANGAYTAEGTTNVSADSTAVLSAKTLAPRAYVSLLQVSKNALTFTELERQIDRAYQKVFANTIHTEVVTGSGTNSFVGLDVTTNKTAVSTAAVSLTGLLQLALKANGTLNNGIILINPDAFAAIINANATSPIVASILATMQLYGMPIYTTNNLAGGAQDNEVWAVAFEPDNYAVGLAGEVMIDTINVKGDVNTYFQAYLFADGKEKVSAEVFYNMYVAS